MRQSSHILMRSICPLSRNIECLPASWSAMRSMDLRTPKGLPQRMHSKGSSSFKVTALIAALVKLMRGSSEMTCSGQVTRQRPHRSEEHTSELQSLMRISYAVFCLQKKKQTRHITN